MTSKLLHWHIRNKAAKRMGLHHRFFRLVAWWVGV